MRITPEKEDGSYGNTPVDEDMLGPEHGEPIRGLTFWGHVDLGVRLLGLGLTLAYAASFFPDVDEIFPMTDKEINVVYWGYMMPALAYLTWRHITSLTPEERKHLW